MSDRVGRGVDDAQDAVEEVSSHPAMTGLARLGHAVNGVLHVVIAFIALQVAWGSSGQSADQSGALRALGSTSLGTATLWVFVVGAGALGLWYLAQAVAPPPGEDEAKDRAKAVAKAVVYGAVAVSAARFAVGSGRSSEQQTEGVTQRLMSAPAGQVLVGLVGLVVLGVGGYYVYKGVTQKFLEDLERNPGVLATSTGSIGYPAKGVVLGIVGLFFVVAAWQEDPKQAQGLDGALKSLKDQAFGPYLLTLVALGVIAFGLYCFVRARYADLD